MRPIINNEKHRNPFMVFLEKSIMVICTLFLWYFLARHVFTKLVTENSVKTIETFKFLGLVAVIIFLILAIWQEYNIYMYRSATRRKYRCEANDDFVAEKFHIDVYELYKLRQAKYLEVRRDNKISYYANQDIIQEISMNIHANKTGGKS